MNLKINEEIGSKLCLLLCGTLYVFVASATDYYVAPGGTGDYTSGNPGGSPAEAAQKATASGDVIHLATGLYEIPDNVNFMVAPGVTLIGGSDNPEETVVSKIVSTTNDSTNARAIYLGRNAVMRNLTSRGGYTTYQAAGVLGYDTIVHKEFFVSNCVVEHASALYKGGASMGGVWRNCVIRNCTIRNASSNIEKEGSGGGIWGATLYECVITNNTSAYLGGGIAGSSTDACTAYNCLIAFNEAPVGGGAGVTTARYAPESCSLYGCTVVSNKSQNLSGQTWGGRGGGASNCYVSNSLVAWNSAGFNYASTSDNEQIGGGVDGCKVYDSTICGNRATNLNGGWRACGGGATRSYLEGCRLYDNYALVNAGGASLSTNVNCVFAGNSATIGGATLGGLLIGCVVSNNVAHNWQGGACYNSTAHNCLFAFNRTATGATCFRGYYEGCLFVSNTFNAASGGSAIGIETDAGQEAVAVNCTVVGNTGGDGAFFNVQATNCIVTSNSPRDVCGASLARRCLFGTTDETPDASCLVGVDPKFAQNGATIFDYYTPRPSSPCRDTGIYFDWMNGATDIAGNPRVKYGMVDMGALECIQSLGTCVLFR